MWTTEKVSVYYKQAKPTVRLIGGISSLGLTAKPGISFSLTASPNAVTTGLNFGASFGYAGGGKIGLTLDGSSDFGFGISSPNLSFDVTYIFDPKINVRRVGSEGQNYNLLETNHIIPDEVKEHIDSKSEKPHPKKD